MYGQLFELSKSHSIVGRETEAMMLNHEGKGESEDNDKNDEDVFQYLGYDVVEHDAKLSV